MLAVIRHGDRTPKQKMKMKVTQVGGPHRSTRSSHVITSHVNVILHACLDCGADVNHFDMPCACEQTLLIFLLRWCAEARLAIAHLEDLLYPWTSRIDLA